MADLVAFLAARLGEDEAVAKAAASVAGPGWKAETYWPHDESRTRTCVRSEDGAFLGEFDDTPDYPDIAAHIARHDPARALREVAAGRAILAEYVAVRKLQERTGSEKDFYRDWVLRHLAAVWSDHPDYDPAWAPG